MSVAEQRKLPPSGAVTPQTLPHTSAVAPAIEDLRFRALVGEAAWAQLPEAVRRRFSKCLAPGDTIVYRGEVVSTQLSRAGRLLAFFARAIGAPLPLTDGATGPALVVVSEDPRLGGQCWLRIYNRPGRFPQAIHSAKRFRGPTGLEEYVGFGIGMALRVTVEDGALIFRSAGYFLALGERRLPLPRFVHPGQMTIEHRDRGGGVFAFELELAHPRFGRLVGQLAHFHDP
ncbi:MAG: DUF4166 domain-containing protein [Hyphomicrobium sp.]